MVKKETVPFRPDTVRITFALPASIWADTIYLVGDFNNWNTTSTPLQLDETTWSVTLDLAIDQAYAYRYLVNNDEWMSDWNADKTILEHDGLTTSVVQTYTSPQVTFPAKKTHEEERILRLVAA